MIHSDFNRRLTDLLELLGVAVLNALLAKVIQVFFSANGVVSAIWSPSGLGLADPLVDEEYTRYCVDTPLILVWRQRVTCQGAIDFIAD